MDSNGRYDIAVVGGGIAGLYCCLYAPEGLNVALFEATERFGGRIETGSVGGFEAEWGSMRFDPGRQYMMARLMDELRLETLPFPEYSSPPAGEWQARYDLEASEKGRDALELFSLGIGRILNMTEPELLSVSEEDLERTRRQGKHRGRYLWELGLWGALADVLSYDAVKLIITEGSFFHGVHENPGVAGTMITWVKMLQMSKYLQGVKGGMQRITDEMLARVKNRGVEVYAGHSLRALVPAGEKEVGLVFDGGAFAAKHVILALPSQAIGALRGIPPDILELVDSVIRYPLLKCFFVVQDPWWEEDTPNMGVRSFPARELHYVTQGDRGNVMVYADRPSISFWGGYVGPGRHDRAEVGGNPDLASAFAGRMSRGNRPVPIPIESGGSPITPSRVLAFGVRDWRRPPYGAGVHLWRAGVKPWQVAERLEAFSLGGGPPFNVHICGEAFSDYQGFMEGAARSAHRALTKAVD